MNTFQPIIESVDSDSEDVTQNPSSLKRKISSPQPINLYDQTQSSDKRAKKDNLEKNGQGVGCFNCGKSGHYLKDCPLPGKSYEKKICFLCNQQGHTSKFCPTANQTSRITTVPSPFDQTSLTYAGTYTPYAYASYGFPTIQQQPTTVTPQAFPIASTDRRCYICNVKGHLSKECPEIALGKSCFNCGSKGHISKECPKEKIPTKCFTCGQLGHVGKNCPEGQRKVCYHCKSTEHLSALCPQKPPVSCYNCFSIGHISAVCPQPLRAQTGVLTCHTCGQIGHKSAECPLLASQANFNRYPATYQQAAYSYYR